MGFKLFQHKPKQDSSVRGTAPVQTPAEQVAIRSRMEAEMQASRQNREAAAGDSGKESG